MTGNRIIILFITVYPSKKRVRTYVSILQIIFHVDVHVAIVCYRHILLYKAAVINLRLVDYITRHGMIPNLNGAAFLSKVRIFILLFGKYDGFGELFVTIFHNVPYYPRDTLAQPRKGLIVLGKIACPCSKQGKTCKAKPGMYTFNQSIARRNLAKP